MKKQTISLNGLWRMIYGDVGQGAPDKCDWTAALPYSVPGDVHTPLIDAGEIAEPTYARNSLDCRWVEDKEFWCERRFILTSENLRQHAELTFEGLDTTADVWLNGQFIGRHNNAFVEITWDITGLIREGENVLLVRIDQGLAEAQSHDLEKMGIMWNNDQPWRSWMRKPQYVYSWDWTVWLASCGIWKNVSLTAYDEAAITDLYACVAQDTVAEGHLCRVKVAVETVGNAQVRCTIRDASGNTVAQGNAGILTIPAAHLWWCNGMGEPYLYTVEAQLLSADGTVIDSSIQRLGVRIIKLTEPDLGDKGYGFTFVLNGEPIFCKGANHIPCDCLPGRITEKKERQLIALAREQHMNMLRVWGGGVYSSEAFMDACDEMGIMVWHDFMYACGYYPDHDPDFISCITDEAQKAIRRLRRHTSLIGWAGNNEVQEMYGSQKQANPDLPFYGQSIYEKILPDLCIKMCPTLIYRPSSPYGGEYQGDCRSGDQHIWMLTHMDSHPHYLDLWHFTDFEVKFFSEFGVIGAMTYETAQECIPAQNMHPDDPVWLHHTNSGQNHRLLQLLEKQYFGTKEYSPQQFILRSQAMQAEITRHIYEEFRRRKFICSGLLFWTLSDSYGVHNWSLIDHALRRKPVYHALKQAQAPLALAICGWDVQSSKGRAAFREHWRKEPGTLTIWGINDTVKDVSACLTCTLLTRRGKVLAKRQKDVLLSANASVQLTEFSLEGIDFDPAETILRAQLYAENTLLNETRYFFAPFNEMTKQTEHIRCEYRQTDDDLCSVTLTSDEYVWMLHLCEPTGVYYSDNDFDLWPGESRTVTVRTNLPDFRPEFDWMKED